MPEQTKETSGANPHWRAMFRKLPFESETTWFILVSALDVVLTYLLIREDRFHEANPVARFFLNHWGVRGLVYFKFAMVGFFLIIAQIIALKQPATARRLLILGTVIVSGVLIYSLYLLVNYSDLLS